MTESGATSMEGDMPVNCSGGVLSSNPIGASGMLRFAEAALQVRGLAGEHQIDGARRALGHAYGGAAQYFAMWVVGSEMPVAQRVRQRIRPWTSTCPRRTIRGASKSAAGSRSIRRRRRASWSTRATSCRTGPSRTASTPIPSCSSSSRDEMRRAGVAKPTNPIGIGHCGPILVALASDEQKDRYLMPMLAARSCGASCSASPAPAPTSRTSARVPMRDGDVYVVNGQKIWTSLADVAKFGILIARTRTDVSKHRGISYFIIPMDLPGIEIRPIRNMTGGARLQRGVLHRRARAGREPHRRGEPRLGHGEDDARQRARLVVDRRRLAVGLRAERARSRRSR